MPVTPLEPARARTCAHACTRANHRLQPRAPRTCALTQPEAGWRQHTLIKRTGVSSRSSSEDSRDGFRPASTSLLFFPCAVNLTRLEEKLRRPLCDSAP